MLEAYIIDEVTEELSASEQAMSHAIELMSTQQPILLAYLFSENFEAFTETEREFLLFLTTVIWKSVFRSRGQQPAISEKDLTEAEEANWTRLQSVQGRRFRERLDVFFEERPEAEELLAFIEDAILEDEDTPVTAEGREPLFVVLKSIIDCLMK